MKTYLFNETERIFGDMERYLKVKDKILDIEKALYSNPKCDVGLFGSLKAYASVGWENSEGQYIYPEILTLICMSEATHGFWYGYVGPSHNKKNCYTALLVHLAKFINADVPENLFSYFNSHTTSFGAYYPCKIQSHDDAYADTNDFDLATQALISMIERFDPCLRDPDIASEHYMDELELRTLEYLGFRRWL